MLTKGYIFILVSSSNDLYAMNDKSKTKLMCFFYYLPHNLPSPTACSHSWMLPKLMLDVSANHKIMTYMIFLLKVDLLNTDFFVKIRLVKSSASALGCVSVFLNKADKPNKGNQTNQTNQFQKKCIVRILI